MSAIIQKLLALSENEGNSARNEEIGWSDVRVAYRMTKPMGERVRAFGLSQAGLRHYTHNDSHYGDPEEGFVDETGRVAVAFPCTMKTVHAKD